MRSKRGVGEGQECLPFDLPPTRSVGRPDEEVHEPVRPPAAPDRVRLRLRTDALASRGWPAGTELLVEPAGRRPRRGDVVLTREGGRLKVGVFDLQLGRRVLRSDRGSTWLGASAEVVGVVTVAGAPLAGMPHVTGPPS
ncbi:MULTISPECIES: hypothetical protein [Nocardioides]|uniref:Peptidase S24/S26A/S26B/S26C domain-containing protein n=1 Tax=Nocardioides vastitatis TaxID=2568655 RepID=A0ABW0ZM93_9ACTN|nr:hypothetical protein [Nocardioides sp.]THI98367.1 hypothetical protein E7Z54_13920 [Nocardioides sp.]